MLPYLIAGAIGFGIAKLFEEGGETFARGGMTNEDILRSFLTSNRETQTNNLSTHYNQYDDFLLLRNYSTLIATRKGNNVKITNQKYSKTTSTITNRLKALAEEMGYSVEYVDKFEEGGETFSNGGFLRYEGQSILLKSVPSPKYDRFLNTEIVIEKIHNNKIVKSFVKKTGEKVPFIIDDKYKKEEYADGGGVGNQLFGNDNPDLVNFDLNELDPFEQMQYNHLSKSSSKAETLQVLINNTEGDYSQLSPRLSEIAEAQYPSDRFAGGGEAKKRRRRANAQIGKTDRSVDKTRVAKPVGYRFTNALASKLRKDKYAVPTEKQITKYLGKGIYKENRRNQSDRDLTAKL